MGDYETRFANFGFAGAAELKKTLENKDTVLLDVRRMDEIEASGKFEGKGHRWVQTPCMPDSCAELEKNLDELLPSKEAPIIIYCRSGRRAATAEKFLKEKGYGKVMNAGGYDDFKTMGL